MIMDSPPTRRIRTGRQPKKTAEAGNEKGDINEAELGKMVINSTVLLGGRRFWRRTLRTNRAYAFMKCVATIVLLDHTTRYGSTPSKFLGSRSCDYHYFHCFVALLDLEGN